MALQQARIQLFNDMKPKSYRRLVSKHIKKYPCDKILLTLLPEHFEQIRSMTPTDDKDLFHLVSFSSDQDTQNTTFIPSFEAVAVNDWNEYWNQLWSLYLTHFSSDRTMAEFYEHWLLIEHKCPSSEDYGCGFRFKFVVTDPFLSQLDCKILVDSLRTYHPSASLRSFLQSFFFQYQYHQLDHDIQHDLSEHCLAMFQKIAHEFDLPSLKHLSMEQIRDVRIKSQQYHMSFVDYVRTMIPRTSFLKRVVEEEDTTIADHRQNMTRSLSRQRRSLSNILKTASNTYHPYSSFQFHIHDFPIWLDTTCFVIQSLQQKQEYYQSPSYHQRSSSYHYPSTYFFQHFVIHEHCYSKNIYTNALHDTFHILYYRRDQLLSFTSKQFQLWSQSITIRNFEVFRQSKLSEIAHGDIFHTLFESICYQSLQSLPSSFHVPTIVSCLMKQVSELSLYQLSNALYSFLSKWNPSLGHSLSWYQSFRHHFTHLYFNMDHILFLPLSYAFPEYFLLSDTEIYDSFVSNTQEVFYQNMIIQYYRQRMNYPFPLTSYPSCPSFSAFQPSCPDHIWDEQLIPLRQYSRLSEHYFNVDIIEEGLGQVGVLIEPPSYYHLPSKNMEHTEQTSIRAATTITSWKDICHFIEQASEPLCLSVQDESMTNREVMEKDASDSVFSSLVGLSRTMTTTITTETIDCKIEDEMKDEEDDEEKDVIDDDKEGNEEEDEPLEDADVVQDYDEFYGRDENDSDYDDFY